MKNLKKVLALVMACAMLFTMSSFAFTDVAEDASYLEAVTMLSKLGIINGYEDGTFLPDNTITRAEAAKVLVCALNAADLAEGMVKANSFTDVPETHWAAGYVNYAASLGIIAGRGEGIFDPEAPVTYEEIVKMVVAMLGYTPVANVKGGYPTGYLYVANNMLKITKGATGVTGDAAKRWVVARLLFNSLEAKMMEQETWSASDPEYIQGDDTLLQDYLEVTKLEGVVVKTFYADFSDKEDQDVTIAVAAVNGYTDDEKLEDAGFDFGAVIDEEFVFDANGTGAEDYLFYTVTAYVKDFTEDDELVAIAPKGNKNSTLEIAFDEFEPESWKDNKTNYYTFEYYKSLDDEEPVVAKVRKDNAKQTDFEYYENGDEADYNNLIANIEGVYGDECDLDGVVRLLDNDGNGTYDYVFVETVTAEVAVKSINEKTYKVTGKTGTDSITLDPEDEDYYVTYIKDGEVADFEDIAEDDILSVVELYDGKVKKVYISSETVEGRVTSVTKGLKIAGAIYRQSNEYATEIAKGEEGTFFLNYNGKIAYKEAEKVSGGNYAFVLAVNTKAPMFGEPVYTVLMMNEKGEWITAELSDRAVFYAWDGTEFVKSGLKGDLDNIANIADYTNGWFVAEAVEDEEYKAIELGKVANYRVIQYVLNSDGEITSITIPKESTEKVDEENFSIADELDEDEYDANRNRFATANGKGGFGEASVIFAVDVETNDLVDVSKKKEVSLASASLFKDEQTYSGLVFDCVDKIYNCAIITSTESSIAEDAALLVVKEMAIDTNEDDEEYIIINGYMNGEEVTLETVADASLEAAIDVTLLGAEDEAAAADFFANCEEDEYAEGAVYEVAVDEAGLVTDINIVFLNDKEAGYVANEGYDYEDETGVAYYYGMLIGEELDGNYTLLGNEDGVKFDFATGIESEINVKGARIINVDKTRKTIKYAVEDSLDSFLDTVVYDDEDRTVMAPEAMDEETVNYAFVKVVDGDVIDVVVYSITYVAAV